MNNSWLLNLSTLQHGGSLQVAISLIEELKNHPNKLILLLSKPLQENLSPEILQNFNHHLIHPSPARSKQSREKIIFLISELSPAFIFTLFGPAYIKTSIPHLMGIGDGWVTHADKLAFSSLSLLEKIQMHLLCAYKKHYFKQATHWITEANISKQGAVKKFKISPEKITVIPNEISVFYKNYLNQEPQLISISSSQPLNFFVFCSAYPHKNLKILIPTVLYLLEKNILNIRFHLTLPEQNKIYQKLSSQIKKNRLENYFINHGPIKSPDSPALYQNMDALLFPTLLETYSVTPLEAMAMGIPALISDIPAHRDLFTEDLVSFFNPLDPENIAHQIITLIENPEAAFQKQKNAKRWLKKIMSETAPRTQAFLNLINQIFEKKD